MSRSAKSNRHGKETLRTMKLTQAIALAAAIVLAAAPVAAQNLLANPSFEQAPHGDFPFGDDYAPTGWTPGSYNYWQSFTGVFDSAWKNPNCNYPIWPDPVHQPVHGDFFLAKWLPPHDPTETLCEYENTHTEQSGGHLRQTVTGLTPGATYYFSAWFANNNPHGWQTPFGWQYPMFRVGVLAQEYDPETGTFVPELKPEDPTDTLGVVFVPLQQPNPEEWSNYLKVFAGSDEAWSKLTGSLTLGPDQNAITYFIEYLTDSNVGYSEAQYVQVDHCRLATTQELAIENVEFTSYGATSATIEFDVTDGHDRITGLSTSDCGVEYGLTDSYGLYQGAIEPDSAPCNGSTPGRPGHYRAELTGLTAGATYHFRVKVNGGTHTYIERYFCPGPPSNPEPVTGSRLYDPAVTPDAAFQALPSVVISNVRAENVTADSADIKWTTDVPADSRVEYGTSTAYGADVSDASAVTEHSIHLDGLLGSTTYHFRVSSNAAGRNVGRSADDVFTTAMSNQIVNGSFEIGSSTGGKPAYWTEVKFAGGMTTFHTPEWLITAPDGIWYCGMIDNFSIKLNGRALYQQVATTPGEVISLYAWSFADAHADCKDGWPAGAPHRFGEIGNQVAIDPTGALPSTWGVIPSTTVWSVPLQSTDFAAYSANQCGVNAQWRRLGLCVKAAGAKATVYLRNFALYSNGWSRTVFDNVFLAPLTPVSSVAALKSQPFQTNVDLTQSGGDGFVVTYVAEPPYDTWENEGQPYFYIEDTDRASGIKVTFGPGLSKPAWLTVGKKVNIKGTLDWGAFYNYTHKKNYYQQLRMDNPCGEVVLRAIEITDAGDGDVPEPVGVTNKTLGGASSSDPWFSIPGVAGGSGANNVGLRVRTWGKIVEIGEDPEGEYYYVIDDGSALPLEDLDRPKPSIWPQSAPGLYVRTRDIYLPMLSDNSREIQVGDYAILTGISSVRPDLDWSDPHPQPDPNNPAIDVPQAMKNKRAIKVEPDGARFFTLP